MSYIRFGLMIITSTVVMFILMYLNTYAWEHLFFSETRTYMALLMGATMAIIMLAYMLGMYSSKRLNIAIFIGAALVFASSLWLVRSQVTVNGPSYMRAMIPHHSIAIMTSERARIRDARVHQLAEEIASAQRREIAEMRYLIADISAGNVVTQIHEDPPAQPGTVADALANTLTSDLDPEPISRTETDRVLAAPEHCRFHRSRETNPILWTDQGKAASMKVNGTLIRLAATPGAENERRYATRGASVAVSPLPRDARDWRQNAELSFTLDQGLSVGYRGFWTCDG
ncbi:DUF305 domain-containing protein [Abyssibacter sp.]|uniref:DUF305 domain-containing protein n=1 Tax=Abyssibacter sp. TaxID=2320200 RepID=UPI0025C72EB2|nr:DUF305 domain-containing protein [Abyssibacter sp.]MCK5859101.1 DUF305 domain-containing protein [Abyssibacter sp.]